MKKNSIILISIIFLFLLVHGYFAYGSTHVKKHAIDEGVVSELLSNRTSIMNRALYGSEDINIIILDLEQIERGKLLEDDINCLIYSRINPTDYPFISDVRVLNANLLNIQDDIYKLRVLVQWELLETEELKETFDYFVEVQQQSGKFFLVNFEPVEQMEVGT